MKYIRLLFSISSNVPRWLIFMFDIFICTVSFILAVVLRYSFKLQETNLNSIVTVLPIVIAVKALFMIYFRLYAGIIRHTSVQDGLKIATTICYNIIKSQ